MCNPPPSSTLRIASADRGDRGVSRLVYPVRHRSVLQRRAMTRCTSTIINVHHKPSNHHTHLSNSYKSQEIFEDVHIKICCKNKCLETGCEPVSSCYSNRMHCSTEDMWNSYTEKEFVLVSL